MPKRPRSVTLLAIAVFLLAGVNLARTAVGIMRWPLLSTLPDTLPILVAIILGAVWGVLWLVEGWGLWTLRHWARPAGIALFVLSQIGILGYQALFAKGPYEQGLIPSMAISSLVGIGLVVWILGRAPAKQAFTPPREEPPSDG